MSEFKIYNVVSALIMTPDDDVLLIRQSRWDRRDNPSANPEDDLFWTFPGGKIDPGESKEQALVREMKEETGLDIDPSQAEYIGKCRYFRLDQNSGADVDLYLIGSWSGSVNAQDPCGFVTEAKFFPLAEALDKIAIIPWLPMREPQSSYLNGDRERKLWTYLFDGNGFGETMTNQDFEDRFGIHFLEQMK
jgi:8-oxo-dGTP diphosphatase